MKLWIRKIAAICITIMTLGMYIPPAYLHTDAEESKEAVSPKTDVNKAVTEPVAAKTETLDTLDNEIDEEVTDDLFISEIIDRAKEQTITKLGPRIIGQVEDEFETVILPNIEEVIKMILTEGGEDELPYYAITEQPSQGFGERIFNLRDYRMKKDVAKFHVRRDHRPLDGYWFNFHYHLSNDNFEKHYEIGEIYWDKNTPPRWMA
ncbi:hypothetical protein GCM10011409_25180 [Lentibacillus populi]|uniref:YpjP-like protein n=1 Tax=Lentibacillus populi TaxID=1827502 RepID=A0A9W5X5U1_9BACI|nr:MULTISPECIES: YpjP family protein [Bacillaceae]GGB46593.1 hypothetical protein GCM10011409_25180 [Lentibacillus populi]